MNQERLVELEDLAHRLEDLQFEIHALLDAEQTDPDDEKSPTAIEVLTAALGQVGTAVAGLDSLMPESDAGVNRPDDDELTDEMMDAPGG
jgi:hypothetical protein